jgi:hypothetical protein
VTSSKIPSPAKTDSGTTSVTHRYSDGEQTVIEEYRVNYGDKGETPAAESKTYSTTSIAKPIPFSGWRPDSGVNRRAKVLASVGDVTRWR